MTRYIVEVQIAQSRSWSSSLKTEIDAETRADACIQLDEEFGPGTSGRIVRIEEVCRLDALPRQ